MAEHINLEGLKMEGQHGSTFPSLCEEPALQASSLAEITGLKQTATRAIREQHWGACSEQELEQGDGRSDSESGGRGEE